MLILCFVKQESAVVAKANNEGNEVNERGDQTITSAQFITEFTEELAKQRQEKVITIHIYYIIHINCVM